jgi:hypothetical protein
MGKLDEQTTKKMPTVHSPQTKLSTEVLNDLKIPTDNEEKLTQWAKDLPRNLRQYLGFSGAEIASHQESQGKQSVVETYQKALEGKIKQQTGDISEEQKEYFANLIGVLADQSVIASQAAALNAFLVENGYAFRNLAALEIKFEKNDNGHYLKYSLRYPIFTQNALSNAGSNDIPPLGHITTEYTFSFPDGVSVSVSSDELDSQFLYKYLRGITSGAAQIQEQLGGGDSEQYGPRYNMLLIECNQVAQALENDMALTYMIQENIDIKEFKKHAEGVISSLSETTKAKLTEEFYEKLGERLEFVKALENGLSQMSDDQITEVARGIAKLGGKGTETKDNKEIYNALSPEAKKKIDAICDRLENRGLMTKVIDYLVMIFCKVPDIARGLTTAPQPDKIAGSGNLSGQNQHQTIA